MSSEKTPRRGVVQPSFDSREPRSRKLVLDFVKNWLRVMWLDIIALIILGAISLGVFRAPVAVTRNFPIVFQKNSGDIVYPTLAYPNRGWIISPTLSGIIALIPTVVVITLAQIRVRSFWDLNNGILGLFQSNLFATIFHVVTKTLVGGLRPWFLAACMPDISLASTRNASGLNGVGYQQIMYTAEICTQASKPTLKNAMSSFPSGHAATGFAGLFYLFLYMNAKLKVWSAHRPAVWKVCLTILPLMGAWLNACLLTVDQAHHWYDILAGSCIGILTALVSYRTCYASIWDSRFNHVPLRLNEDLDLTSINTGYREGTFTRAAGWGEKPDKAAGERLQSLAAGDRTGAQAQNGRGSAEYVV